MILDVGQYISQKLGLGLSEQALGMFNYAALSAIGLDNHYNAVGLRTQ